MSSGIFGSPSEIFGSARFFLNSLLALSDISGGLRKPSENKQLSEDYCIDRSNNARRPIIKIAMSII